MKSRMTARMRELKLTALELSKQMRESGHPQMTESRIYRISTGRSIPTMEERLEIAKKLGLQGYELFI